MPNKSDNIVAVTLRLVGVCIVLASLSAFAVADSTLQPHVAEYKVKISVLGGKLNTELKAIDGGYVATHVVKATGLARMFAGGRISDASEFAIADSGIRPTRFESEDTITRDKTRATISFDWESGEARGTVNGEEYLLAMEELMHDRVSIQYELMHDLLNDRAVDEYLLFGVDKLRTVSIRKIGHRDVKVPAGSFTVVGIQHQAVNSSRITTFWCAEELGYLPVIIERHRDGELKMRATLKSYAPTQS